MKPTLTPQESDLYIKIVQRGNMDDMFDFAYAIGEERQARRALEQMKEIMNPPCPTPSN